VYTLLNYCIKKWKCRFNIAWLANHE